jgi:hypothetical protein
VPYPADHKAHSCVKCGLHIAAEWSINDQTMREFFGRLSSAIPVKSEAWHLFRLECEERERAGRSRFGQSFHGRRNLREAAEEAADGALYCALDTLVVRREGRGDEDMDLALRAANYFYLAYEATLQLRAKRRGAP